MSIARLALMVILQIVLCHAAFACQQGNSSVNTTAVTTGAAVTVTPSYNPTSPADQIFNFSVSITNASNSACTFVLAVHRATLPASMINGSNSLIYVVERSGGGSIMYTGAAPTAGQSTTSTTVARGGSTTVSLRVRLPAGQTTATAMGTYTDISPLIQVWEINGSGTPTTLRSSVSMSVTNVNGSACVVSNPSNTGQTISVGVSGLTQGMVTAAPTFEVTCSAAANVVVSSQNGAVTLGNVAKTALAAVSGFRNKIEYAASVNAPAGTVTLTTSNSATAPASTPTVLFSATSVTNRVTTVTITPESSTVPLLAGSYGDVLTVTLVPQ